MFVQLTIWHQFHWCFNNNKICENNFWCCVFTFLHLLVKLAMFHQYTYGTLTAPAIVLVQPHRSKMTKVSMPTSPLFGIFLRQAGMLTTYLRQTPIKSRLTCEKASLILSNPLVVVWARPSTLSLSWLDPSDILPNLLFTSPSICRQSSTNSWGLFTLLM